MFGVMSMMKLAAPLCLLQASMIGLVSGLQPSQPVFLESTIEGQDFRFGNQFCVSINDGSKKADDLRDINSFYVNTRNTCERKTLFELVPAPAENGVLIQAVDIRTQLGETAEGWYLAVHDFYESDNAGNGDLRVILHRDVNKAAVWEFTSVEGRNLLAVAGNRDVTGVATVGCYLSLAAEPFRSPESFYLAVTEFPVNALPVSAALEPTGAALA